MAVIIAPSRAKSIAELQRLIMDWELLVAEHEARHNECGQDSVKVAALKRMMTAEMEERYIEGTNTYPELRSRVAAYVWEKMIQQSHVPMDIGEAEGEIEGSDDQIDELRGARKPRRDERSTHQRGPGNSPGERHHWEGTRNEKQTTGLTGHREGMRSGKQTMEMAA